MALNALNSRNLEQLAQKGLIDMQQLHTLNMKQ